MKSKGNTLLWVAALAATLAGCRPATSESSAEAATGEVVIVVEGELSSTRYYYTNERPDGPYMANVHHVPLRFSASEATERIEPETAEAEPGDTLVVPLHSEWLYVRYRFNPLSVADFVARRGDTVVICRDTARLHELSAPTVRIVNRPAAPLDTDYRSWQLSRFGEVRGATLSEATANVLYALRLFGFDYTRGWEYVYKEYGRLLERRAESLRQECRLLDSLQTAGALSHAAAHFFRERNRWALRTDSVYGVRRQLTEATADSLLRADYRSEAYDADACGFRRDYLHTLAHSRFFSRGIRVSHGTENDWAYTYAQLEADTLLQRGELWQQLLTECLDGMVDYWPERQSKPYVERAAVLTADSLFADRLQRRYADRFTHEAMAEDDMLLVAPDGSKTTFSQLMESLRGKAVYVDFWASWCMPCRAEMPAAARLRHRCADHDIAFVYLSKDDTDAAMTASLPKLELTDCLVYRIVNHRSARFISEHNVRLIPRFMLFDRSGRLIKEKAPRPSDEETFKLLVESSK